MRNFVRSVNLAFLLLLSLPAAARPAQKEPAAAAPISIHPANPKYFLFRGKPLALITATEHYGSVVNSRFDFERYLRDAADKKQTLTRLFLLFREQQSQRNPYSPLKVESPDFVTPYLRTGPGKALDGEPKFNLDQWNPVYFARLHRFLARASELGIVVEVTLFSNTYASQVWALNPLRSENNINGLKPLEWPEYNTLKDPELFKRQAAFVRKVIGEINHYDNIYYEICNEPGGGVKGFAPPSDVDAWQTAVAKVVREEMSKRPQRHLVFGSEAFSYTPKFNQGTDASFKNPDFDAVNVHPLPDTHYGGRTYQMGNFMSKELMLSEFRDYCLATYAERKPMIMDEDNCASLYRDEVGWTIHRKRAWTALLSGSHYDYIDFSINVGTEAGTEDITGEDPHLDEEPFGVFPLLRFCAVARSKQLATGQTCRHRRVCAGNRRRGVHRLPRRCSGNHRFKGQLTDSGRPQATAPSRTLRGKTLFAFQRRLLTSNLDPE